MHLKELIWIRELQSTLRSTFLDNIMFGLNLVDTFPFYVLLITLIWFCYKRDLGIKLIFVFFITSFINQQAKELLGQPRPCQMDLSVCMIKAKSFGIPSGAAQSMVTIFYFLCYQIRDRRFWGFSIFFVLLISFSRIYLGLHFFSDIVLGWILGIVVTTAYIYILPYAISYIKKQSKTTLTIHALLLAAVLSLLALNKNTTLVIFSSLGVILGLIYGNGLKDPTKLFQRIYRPMIVLIGVFILMITTLILPIKGSIINLLIQRICQIFAGVWIASWVNIVIEKTEKKISKIL